MFSGFKVFGDRKLKEENKSLFLRLAGVKYGNIRYDCYFSCVDVVIGGPSKQFNQLLYFKLSEGMECLVLSCLKVLYRSTAIDSQTGKVERNTTFSGFEFNLLNLEEYFD